MALPRWNSPEEIVNGCIKEQSRIITGYKGNPKADPKKCEEALNPKHAAISLAGEPTLYSRLGDLIKQFHKRGFTTFLVSNGTLPEALARLSEEPTQLYISVSAFNKKTFKENCRPHIKSAWERLQETLSLLPSFECPTVIRLTLARHVNMKHPELYAKIIKKAHPTYVEPKAYMHVGSSQTRLKFENMPTHHEIQKFASQLAEGLNYNVIDKSPESRVVLLSHLEKPIKL
jgi:tRNA wybutosine-synthesizing protein 1